MTYGTFGTLTAQCVADNASALCLNQATRGVDDHEGIGSSAPQRCSPVTPSLSEGDNPIDNPRP